MECMNLMGWNGLRKVRAVRPAASSTALEGGPFMAALTYSIRPTASQRMRPAFSVRILPALHQAAAFERLILPLVEEQG